jgi:hypothetical protein
MILCYKLYFTVFGGLMNKLDSYEGSRTPVLKALGRELVPHLLIKRRYESLDMNNASCSHVPLKY